jgi:hypothetical protein
MSGKKKWQAFSPSLFQAESFAALKSQPAEEEKEGLPATVELIFLF